MLFLDTCQLAKATESEAGESLSNANEAVLVMRIAQSLLAAGLPAASLGLISPFNGQVGE